MDPGQGNIASISLLDPPIDFVGGDDDVNGTDTHTEDIEPDDLVAEIKPPYAERRIVGITAFGVVRT